MPVKASSSAVHLHRVLAVVGLAVWLIVVALGVHDAARNQASPAGIFTDTGDFHCFFDAALAARTSQGPDQDLYSAGSGGYIYPPLLAWALQPLTLLPRHIAAVVWVLSMAALIPLASWLAAVEFVRRFRMPSTPLGVWAAAAFGLLVLADKFRRELVEGNCNLLIILAGILALRWLTRRPWLAGVILGLAINIKYLPLVFIPYLIARGRFKTLAGLAIGTIAFALLPAVSFGWSQNLAFLDTAFGGLLNLGGSSAAHAAAIKPLSWDKSLSFPSALARWSEQSGVEGAVLIGTAVIAAIALAIAWAIYLARHTPLVWGRWGKAEDSPDRAGIVGLEWAMLAAGVLAFSPQTPARHMNMALILCVLAGALFLFGRSPGRWIALAGAIIFSASMVLPPASASTQWMLDAWRSISGASIGLLVFLYCVQWAGLTEARRPDLTDRSAPC